MGYLSPEQSLEKRQARAAIAARQVAEAASLAEENGLGLVKHTQRKNDANRNRH